MLLYLLNQKVIVFFFCETRFLFRYYLSVSFIRVEKQKEKLKKKMLNLIFYEVLVLFYEHRFSFNFFEIVMVKYFKRKSDKR